MLEKILVFIFFTFRLIYSLDHQDSHDTSETIKLNRGIDIVVDPDTLSIKSDSLRTGNNKGTNKNQSKKHILMFHPWSAPSHLNQLKPLIQGLLDSGNIVTSVLVFKTKINHKDYTEIIVEDGLVLFCTKIL